MKPCNILYLHSHDTGRFIQPYGFPFNTPNLQRFAQEGVVFEQAFSVAPSCSPSRTGLLTGMYPHSCGMYGLAGSKWGFELEDYSRHLGRFLKRNGYRTALAGIQHLAKDPTTPISVLDYDEILNPDSEGEDSPEVPERAADFIARQEGSWFLSVGLDETHRQPIQEGDRTEVHFSKFSAASSSEDDPAFGYVPPHLPDLPETRADMSRYAHAVSVLDRRIGRVLEALDNSPHRDNTLVLITTDHGLAFPGMKCTLSDYGTGVMMMMRGPGGFTGGKRISALVSHLDFYPTVCDLLELPEPDWLEGRSLLPLLNGQADQVRDRVFMEQTWHEVPEPMRAVRTESHKLVRRYLDRGPRVENCDAGLTKEVLVATGEWFDQPYATSEALYDLRNDPLETQNLIDDPACAELANGLRMQLDVWQASTKDPLLDGRIPPAPYRAS